MDSSNDSTIVLRLPKDLKASLQRQAEQIDVSLSEIIRMKLLIAEKAVHREPVFRLGDTTYRLWDVLRPDILEFDLVASNVTPGAGATLRTEPGRNRSPIGIDATDAVMTAISNSRTEALRFGSAKIAPVHIALGLLRIDCNATRAVASLCGSVHNVLSELERHAATLAGAGINPSSAGDVPFDKRGAKVLKVVYLESKLYKLDLADSSILLLALLRDPLPAFTATSITYDRVRALIGLE